MLIIFRFGKKHLTV